jgi:hypothetical protein
MVLGLFGERASHSVRELRAEGEHGRVAGLLRARIQSGAARPLDGELPGIVSKVLEG